MAFKLSKREHIIFTACLILGGAFVLMQLVIRPIRDEEDLVQQKIELAQAQLQKDTLTVQKLKDINKEYEALLSSFGQAKSDETETSSMISAIQDVAAQTKINIANMQTQRVVNKEFYKQFSVQLVFEGNWAAIVEFVYHLQNKPHMFDVEEINLDKNSISGDVLRGRLTLSRLRVPVE